MSFINTAGSTSWRADWPIPYRSRCGRSAVISKATSKRCCRRNSQARSGEPPGVRRAGGPAGAHPVHARGARKPAAGTRSEVRAAAVRAAAVAAAGLRTRPRQAAADTARRRLPTPPAGGCRHRPQAPAVAAFLRDCVASPAPRRRRTAYHVRHGRAAHGGAAMRDEAALAMVHSRAPVGFGGSAGACRSGIQRWTARLLHRRPARGRGSGKPGAGARGDSLGRLRFSRRPHHHQSVAGGPAQRGRPIRPADRGRHARRQRPTPRAVAAPARVLRGAGALRRVARDAETAAGAARRLPRGTARYSCRRPMCSRRG